MEEVKKQHEERAIDFLVNELEVYETEEEAQARFQMLVSDWPTVPSNQHRFESPYKERVFFISAREMLNMRMNRSKGIGKGDVIIKVFFKLNAICVG